MKVLITGISGFVGTHVTQHLLRSNFEVVGLDHSPRQIDNVNVLQADILNAQHLYTILAEQLPDAIIHLAAQASPGLSFDKPRLTFEINLLGTLGIFEAIREIQKTNPEYRPRIIATGSVDEYGPVPVEQLPITEQTTFNPNNPYAISKVATYYLSMQYATAYNLDIMYISPFNQLGPGQMPGFFIPDMCSQIVNIEAGRQSPIIQTGNLDAKRDFVDVRDVARAYELTLNQGKSGTRYNLSSGTSHSMKSILESLLAMTNSQITHEFDQSRMRPTDTLDRYGTSSQIAQDTGWQPQITLNQSLQDTLDWYRGNQHLWQP